MFKYNPPYGNGKEPVIEEQDVYRIEILFQLYSPLRAEVDRKVDQKVDQKVDRKLPRKE